MLIESLALYGLIARWRTLNELVSRRQKTASLETSEKAGETTITVHDIVNQHQVDIEVSVGKRFLPN